MIKCNKCQSDNNETAKFCGACGSPLSGEIHECSDCSEGKCEKCRGTEEVQALYRLGFQEFNATVPTDELELKKMSEFEDIKFIKHRFAAPSGILGIFTDKLKDLCHEFGFLAKDENKERLFIGPGETGKINPDEMANITFLVFLCENEDGSEEGVLLIADNLELSQDTRSDWAKNEFQKMTGTKVSKDTFFVGEARARSYYIFGYLENMKTDDFNPIHQVFDKWMNKKYKTVRIMEAHTIGIMGTVFDLEK